MNATQKVLLLSASTWLYVACGDDSSKTLADAGQTQNDASTTANCDAKSAALPTTQAVVDATTYYLVLNTVQGDPNMYRVQMNFGTEAQFRKCPEEPGQNSTFSVTMSYKTKPTGSAEFNFSDERVFTATDKVNFYVTFFNNTGHARQNKNYLTPNNGKLNATITATTFSAPLSVTMTNETDANDDFELTGTLAIDW